MSGRKEARAGRAHRSTREFDRRVQAHVAARAADTLRRDGITDPMWESLQALHLARLTPERGARSTITQRTLAALQRRGLAEWRPIDGEDTFVIWRCTEEGTKMVKKGRPE